MTLGAVLLLSNAGHAQAPCRIAALGDSLTAGYGVAADEAFPAVLERELRARGFACDLINAGVSGDTTAGGRARVDWLLADDPTHMILELGANDGLRGLPVEQMRDNLAAIIERFQAENIPVLLTGMLPPPNYGEDYFQEFEAVFPALAEEYGTAFYRFFLEDVAGQPELNQPDGIHPTAEGVEVIVENILPTVTDWLRETGVEPAAG